MNGDGQADYGSCIFKKRNAQSYMAIQTVAAPFVQTEGTAQGFHFDGATMKPVVNNEAWKKAFELYKETGKYGPPEELNMDIGDTRALFKDGRCGLLIEWGDPGTLQLDPDAAKVKGLIFAVGAVGSTEVWIVPPASWFPSPQRRRRTRSMASTTHRSPLSAAGPGPSTPRPTRRRRTQPMRSFPT
jgi:hypothetical protein